MRTQESGNQKDRQQKKSEERLTFRRLSGTDVKAFRADGTFSKREARGWEKYVGKAKTAQDSGFTDECAEN